MFYVSFNELSTVKKFLHSHAIFFMVCSRQFRIITEMHCDTIIFDVAIKINFTVSTIHWPVQATDLAKLLNLFYCMKYALIAFPLFIVNYFLLSSIHHSVMGKTEIQVLSSIFFILYFYRFSNTKFLKQVKPIVKPN